MARRIFFIPALFLLLSSTSPLIGSTQVDTTAIIATWNVLGFNPIPEDRIQRIAEGIADLDPEVIALQEVNPDSAAQQIVAELQKLGADYEYTVLSQPSSLNLALLHKVGVMVTNPHFIPGSDDGNRYLRKALTATIRIGQFDFVFITVHNKAGRDSDDRETRTRQAKAIANYIRTATSGDEKDVVLLGDYNMRPGQDQENFDALNPEGFLRFVSSVDLAGQSSHISDPGRCRGSLLDGLAVSKDYTGEYIEGSLRIFPINREFGFDCLGYVEKVSDHFPLLARFSITVDDD